MSITLLDATSDSLTISWPGSTDAEYYILEYRTAEDSEFETLSENLTQTQCRKRNLSPDYEYFFRVAPVYDDGVGDWMEHDDPFLVLTAEEEEFAMAPPRVRKAADNQIRISWQLVKDAYAYEVQIRENLGGAEWETIADEYEDDNLTQKGLNSKRGYQFRVRPLNGEYEEAFSHPSDCCVAAKGVEQPPPVTHVHAPANISMPAPWCKNAGSQALLIRWRDFEGAEAYELQMKENKKKGKLATIAPRLSGTEVKKKNLTSKTGYQFRVRPLGTSETRWSGESIVAIASG